MHLKKLPWLTYGLSIHSNFKKCKYIIVIFKNYFLLIGHENLVQKEKTVATGEEKAIEIEKTDAVKFSYSDESWYTLRPSGTEPKVKLYIYVKDADKEVAKEKLVKFEEKVLELLYSID